MGLHIEFDASTASPRELQAVKALVLSLLGETAMTTTIGGVMPELSAMLPIATALAASAEPVGEEPPYYGEPDEDGPELHPEDDGAPIGSIPPVPVATPQAVAEALLQAETARVAGAASTGPELDAKGKPWDMRIHTAEKTKNKDGSWRYRRNTDKALIAQVEAELTQVMAANGNPAPTVTDPAAAFGAPGVTTPAVTDPAAAFGGNAANAGIAAGGAPATTPESGSPHTGNIPPVPAVASPSETPAVPTDLGDFARVMRTVAAKQKAGTVTTEMVNQIAINLGLTGTRDLAKRPDLIPAFEAMLP